MERKKTELQARPDTAPEQSEAEQLALDAKLENIALEIKRTKDELAYYDAAEEALKTADRARREGG